MADVSIERQINAVKEAATRAASRVIDAELIWTAGDYRVRVCREYADELEAAWKTLRDLKP